MFLTATPKIYKGNSDNVYCMDNIKQYGDTIAEFDLAKAIEIGKLTDYQIITPVTNNEQIKQFIEMSKK